jgi:hypothetical protein
MIVEKKELPGEKESRRDDIINNHVIGYDFIFD